ncbi:MAG TPA: glutamyl-tRNA reductase, partial [Polyangiaceae bacterium]
MIVVVGLSHKSAPVDVREKFATGADVLPQVLARLSSRRELSEVMFLSTCNRVEVMASAEKASDARAASRAIRESLQEYAGLGSAAELEPYLYVRDGMEAVRHIFRVSASLDSMVLGEPQILGQVKDAFDAATSAGTLKHYLGRCVNRAFTVAKRVRTETALGAGTVSISSVAVDLARKIFGDLSDHAVLLVGAGEMAEAAAKSLGKGARSVHVCNRSFDRAAALAAQFGGS